MKKSVWIFAVILTLAVILSILADNNRQNRIKQRLDGIEKAVAAIQKDSKLFADDIKKLTDDYKAVIQENADLKLENKSQKDYIKWLDRMIDK